MKTAPVKSNPKDMIYRGRKSGHEGVTAHDREGRVIVRGAKGPAQKLAAPAVSAAIAYDAEDIEEANRIGAALCRQHAR